jgi:hypothetical protein
MTVQIHESRPDGVRSLTGGAVTADDLERNEAWLAASEPARRTNRRLVVVRARYGEAIGAACSTMAPQTA